MIFRCFGLFWRRDEINWFPGKGAKNGFRLLGRQGAITGHLRVADFRAQIGIYILYGNHGPHYVGLTRKRSIGLRLKDHMQDDHKDEWDRFSWFGFRSVAKGTNGDGIQNLKRLPVRAYSKQIAAIIGDVEALLIKAMALHNKSQMNFADDGAKHPWVQIKRDELDKYLGKLSP